MGETEVQSEDMEMEAVSSGNDNGCNRYVSGTLVTMAAGTNIENEGYEVPVQSSDEIYQEIDEDEMLKLKD